MNMLGKILSKRCARAAEHKNPNDYNTFYEKILIYSTWCDKIMSNKVKPAKKAIL